MTVRQWALPGLTSRRSPAGRVPSRSNVGECDQSADPLKSTLAPENTDAWSFRVTSPSGSALPNLVTAPIEAASLRNVTVPPENSALPKLTKPPENPAE